MWPGLGEEGEARMEFRVLGPLEVWNDGRMLPIRAPKQRALLAALLMRANQLRSIDELVDLIWGDAPPSTARNTVAVYVRQLRKALVERQVDPGPSERLVTAPSAYLIRVEPGELDLHRFKQLAAKGREAALRRAFAEASDALRAALGVWRGAALADVASDRLREAEVAHLEERRIATLEERVECDLALGRHLDLVGELGAQVAAHPTRERLRGQLMLALYRSGRQVEALAVYRDGRRALVEELGLEPSRALQRLERAILAGDESLDWRPSTVDAPRGAGAPCQLPPDLPDFTGRGQAIARAWELLQGGDRPPGTMAVVAIDGAAGVGKTALAVHLAHGLRARFPDGQLFVNLRGMDPQPLDPSAVLAEFLRALGVDGTAVPDGLEARVRDYLARLADRRVLVVLDNAAGEAQVRPLLPGWPGSAAIVTGRTRLAGLEGAHPFELEVFELAEAVELIGRIAGNARVAAEPGAARSIARRCGYVPLAVRIAGARLLARPHWRLADLAERLGDEDRRLGELQVGDLEIRASIALSYNGLDPAARRAFRLLGLVEAPDFAAWTATALLDGEPRGAEDVVERLVEAHLLEVAGRDPAGQLRYRWHELLRLFARERLAREDPSALRDAALGRLLGAALTLAEHADALLVPGTVRVVRRGPADRWRPPGPPPAVWAQEVVRGNALAWFEAERETLCRLVAVAADVRRFDQAVELACALTTFLETGAYFADWQRTHQLAVAAAYRSHRPASRVAALRALGDCYRDQGHFDKAVACLELAKRIADTIGDRLRQGQVALSLGAAYWDQGRLDPAHGLLSRALDVFTAEGDRVGIFFGRRGLGNVLRMQGRLAAAAAVIEPALADPGAPGARWQGYLHRDLGVIRRDEGDLAAAERHLRRAVALLREAADRRGEAHALRSLGVVYQQQGRLAEAVGCLTTCLDRFVTAGDRLGQAYALRNLADAQRAQGRLTEALQHLQRCLPLLAEFGDRRGQAYALQSLGELHAAQDRIDEATTCLGQAATAYRQLGLELAWAQTLARLGDVHAGAGRDAAARREWQQALPVLQAANAPDARLVEGRLRSTPRPRGDL
jgi:DNA-binding SARP family transcriptional activator/tetratricopeptide (TPR) repeat protein